MTWALIALLALSADDLHGDPLPPGALARLGTLRFRHPGHRATGFGFSADGQTLVAGGEGNTVRVWDARTGRVVREIHMSKFYLRGLALSPDGKLAAVGGTAHEKDGDPGTSCIRFIEVATGKVRRTLTRPGREDNLSLAFTPDGKHLASVGRSGIVRIEEVESGTELIQERIAARYPRLVVSGGTVVIGGNSATSVYLWDWQSGKPPRPLKTSPHYANDVSLSKDGRMLAIGDDRDGGAHLWDTATGKLLKSLTPTAEPDPCGHVALSPDGRLLAAFSYRNRRVILWNPVTGHEVRRLPVGDRFGGDLAWSGDSRRLAVLEPCAVRVWDVTTGKETPALPEGHRERPGTVALLADGTAMTAADDGTVRLWDADTGKHRRVLRVSEGWVRGAAVSPDGRWVVTSTVSGDNAVSLWELKTGKLLYRLPGHGSSGGQRVVAFTSDSKQFLSWGDDRFLRAWAVRNGKATADWELRADGEMPPDPDEPDNPSRFYRFGAATFSRDGRSLVLAGMDGFFIFDVKTGEQVRKISREQGVVSGAAISPDGKLLLAGSWGRTRRVTNPNGSMGFATSDTTVSLHDLTTGRLVHEQKHARSSTGPVAFSPDGKSFAVAAPDNTISFHDTATGVARGTIQKVPSRIWSLAFSPDGKRIITGLDDTTALIYPVPPKEKPR
jgi:WD40 repeat protein